MKTRSNGPLQLWRSSCVTLGKSGSGVLGSSGSVDLGSSDNGALGSSGSLGILYARESSN